MSEFSKMKLNLMGITYSSAVDGTGFRDVVFVSFCPHRCDGCHNTKTWDKQNGHLVSLEEVYNDLTKSTITNVTYSGGEPMEQADALCVLTTELKKNTNKTFWIYSGYTFEEIMADENKKKLLKMCDVLVDGRFDKYKTELNLRFKGSTNQRIIDIKKSLDANMVVLFDK